LTVLRFTDEEIFTEMEKVHLEIEKYINEFENLHLLVLKGKRDNLNSI
jgi:very-short-patch-repair endonuclease